MEEKNKKYNIFISNFTNYLSTIKIILQIKNDYPQYFKEEISQIGLLGSFPYSIWSCAQMGNGFTNNISLENDLRYILDNNLKLIFDFSNTNLKQENFYDSFSNFVLNMTNELKIDYSICITNKDLAKFIKEKYNNINFINANYNKQLFDDEFFTSNIIDWEFFNNNKEEIEKNSEKYILKLNSFCENCYSCKEKISKAILNFEIYNNTCEKISKSFESSKENKFFVSQAEIEKNSITNFIINLNSTEVFENIEVLLYYLVKEENQAEVKLMLLKQIYNNK